MSRWVTVQMTFLNLLARGRGLGWAMSFAIGVDVGGTMIKAGLVRLSDGELVERLTVPTRDGEFLPQGEPAFVEAVRICVATLEQRAGEGELAVGLAAPGLVAVNGRAIRWMPGRMAGIEGLDWCEACSREVRVFNDAQAALLGEVWTGAGRGCEDVMMLTLGTGVGGAIYSGGRLMTGRLGRAGHLGHVSLDSRGPADACLTPGSLELAIGNQTISERTCGRFGSTHDLVAAVRSGDEEASGWWEESVRCLAVALASLINVVDPERVILGGGIASGAGQCLFDPLRHWMEVYEWRPEGGAVPLVEADLGEWAGVVGAVHGLRCGA